ncbi:MAG: hypothetical protein KIIPBIDF_00351 [Candidatus Methanoperedenaceae archaeon GB50]|nr:MAG: hypothetical protein KIIPBIDF_00351 [Candidatus Methanoperedenaceae archaeon GB50]
MNLMASYSYKYLIRKEVNGNITNVTADTHDDWKTLCLRCHYREHTNKSCLDWPLSTAAVSFKGYDMVNKLKPFSA